jgi:hypothetical protein
MAIEASRCCRRWRGTVILKSTRGPLGGYELAREERRMMVREILRAGSQAIADPTDKQSDRRSIGHPITRVKPRYRPSSKIVGGNPWPSVLSSLRPVLCAPKSGLPSGSFCVLVHCQCAICDLKFAMGFAAKADTIKQADIDCFSL